ncbi:uncharacterized protein [Acropora muricata]|uniref:uncharacterized protein isoform X3 n=1 Tax=Acropora muricata TaxID=159855 RepID=UPI0034E58ACF
MDDQDGNGRDISYDWPFQSMRHASYKNILPLLGSDFELGEIKENEQRTHIELGEMKERTNIQLGEMKDVREANGVPQDGLGDDKIVTPPEINLRGPRALEAYNKALTEGKTRLKRIPIMLIGQDRSGKTSLKKSLQGLRFNPEEKSTDGIDVDPSHFKVTTEIWKAGKKDQAANKEEMAISFEQRVARVVFENLRQQELTSETVDSCADSSNSSGVAHADGGSRVFQTKDNYQTETKVRDSNVSSGVISKEIETLIRELGDRVDKMESDDYLYSVFWDFAGESVYYETHQLFLTSRAVYLLVYDLSQNPEEIAEPVQRRGVFEKSKETFCMNRDYLDYWMTSVSSQSNWIEDHDLPSASTSTVVPKKLIPPPVLLVCTHSDKPFGGENPSDLAIKLYGSLATKPYSTQLYDKVFVVDNTKSGMEMHCPEVQHLRKSILDVIKDLQHTNEYIPIKWLKYEKALKVVLDEGHKKITFEHARQIASEVCQIHDEQEFVTVLDFLHDQRIIIHFDGTDELNKLVVLDPQWLIDVFKKVITVKRFDGMEKGFKDLWDKLEREGILEEKLLKHMWGSLAKEHDTFESLIAMMENFSLLCSWPSSDEPFSKKYLVPSMLRWHPPQDIHELITSARLPSLFIKFESGHSLSNLFPRLVVQFLQWGRNKFWSTENPRLFKNFARLYTKSQKCSVVLLCHSSLIEVVVHGGNDPSLKDDLEAILGNLPADQCDSLEVLLAREIFGQLMFLLDCFCKDFIWLKRMKYQAGVICRVCCHERIVKYCTTHLKYNCERDECLHFIPESELRNANQPVTCTRSPGAVDKVGMNDFSVWFPSLREETTTDAISAKLLCSRRVTPLEISLRGPRALRAYNKALTEGKTRLKRIPIMFIGQDRSGKTSLKKSLQGLRFNPEENSTDGIDVDPSHFKVTTEIWKAGKNDQAANKEEMAITFEHRVARVVFENLRHEQELSSEEKIVDPEKVLKTSPATSTEAHSVSESSEILADLSPAINPGHAGLSVDSFSTTQIETVEDYTDSSRLSGVAHADGFSQAFQTTDNYQKETKARDNVSSEMIPREIETLIRELRDRVDKMESEDYLYSVLWDFAGESVYYETHQLFLTSRAVYLLVYDLSRDPEEIAQPVEKQGIFKNIEEKSCTKTNFDYLDYWMTSVSSQSSQIEDHNLYSASTYTVLPKTLPPVILVCTHSDKPFGGKDPSELARSLYGSLETKPYNKQLYDGVFVVDNTKSGMQKECSEVQRLRKCILDVIEELPHRNEYIPIKWLRYEKALIALMNKGPKRISFDYARQIASEVCQIHDDQEFKTVLDFLHDQRIIIHFDGTDKLNKLVVLDPQWLIDVFKKVITVKRFDHMEKGFKDLWVKLEREGILEEKLLKHMWGSLAKEHDTFESLIAMMENFSLLCSWPSSDEPFSKKYLVPSMLRWHPPQDIHELITSARLPSLFIKFESGHSLSNLFPRLVVQFLQWGGKDFWSTEDPHLYKKFARFYTKDEKCSVVLLCHSSLIEVIVRSLKDDSETNFGNSPADQFEVFCAREVLNQLMLLLECFREKFCWLKRMKYQAGAICPVCCHERTVKYCTTHHEKGCQQEECLHFIPESKLRNADQPIFCPRSLDAVSKVGMNYFSAWFPSSLEETRTDTISGKLLCSRGGTNMMKIKNKHKMAFKRDVYCE